MTNPATEDQSFASAEVHDDLDHEALAELATGSHRLLHQLERSIRASVAAGARRDRSWREDAFDRAESFAARSEERLYDLGYELGTIRVRAAELLRRQLIEECMPFFAYFHGYLVLANHINHRAAGRWRRSRRGAARLDVLGELHSQALGVADELVGMLSTGYPSGALARWRTLHELCTIAKFIGGAPLSVARRYKSSHVVDQWLEIKRGILEDALNDPRRMTDAESYIEEVQGHYDRLVEKYGTAYGRPYGWAAEYLALKKVTFSDIEEWVRLARGDKSHRYVRASQHIHGARLSAVRTFTDHSEVQFLRIPTWADLFEDLWDIVWSLNDVTTELVSAVHDSQGVDEAWHWGAAAYIVALDAATEGWRRPIDVNPGFLNILLAYD